MHINTQIYIFDQTQHSNTTLSHIKNIMKLTYLGLIRSEERVEHSVVKSLQTLSRRHQRHSHLDWAHALHLPVIVIVNKSNNTKLGDNYRSKTCKPKIL